jgi:hypothetical protein
MSQNATNISADVSTPPNVGFYAYGTNSIQTNFPVSQAGYPGSGNTLEVSAIDNVNGPSVTEYVVIFDNPRLSEEIHLGQRIMDFDSTRILYLEAYSGSIKIRNRTNGLDTIVGTESRQLPTFGDGVSFSDSTGYLTPHGAIFVDGNGVEEWVNGQLITLQQRNTNLAQGFTLMGKGSYAAWQGTSSSFYVRDLIAETTTTTNSGQLIKVTANGNFVYTALGNYYLSPSSAPITVDTGNAPASDGTNTVFIVQTNFPGTNRTSSTLFLLSGNTTNQLSPWVTNNNFSYDVEQGWLAYTLPSFGVSQVFRQPPGGSPVQLTFWSSSSYISWLDTNGNLVYIENSVPTLVRADGSTVSLGSSISPNNGPYKYNSGAFETAIGRSLFAVNLVRIFSRIAPLSVATNSFGMTVIGDNGVTAIIQSSSDLTNWFPVATNTMSSSGFNFYDPILFTNRGKFYRTIFP